VVKKPVAKKCFDISKSTVIILKRMVKNKIRVCAPMWTDISIWISVADAFEKDNKPYGSKEVGDFFFLLKQRFKGPVSDYRVNLSFNTSRLGI